MTELETASPPRAAQAESLSVLLAELVRRAGSDLHLRANLPPYFRIDGELVAVEGARALTGEELERFLGPLLPAAQRTQLAAGEEADFGLQFGNLGRFRVNVFRERRGIGAVFRLIPARIPTAEELNLPQVVRDWALLRKGLILVTGPTGSGKSTTLAAILNLANNLRSEHIVTIEDPIEFVHPDRKALITQREVGRDTQSFKDALRAALREDPDVVLIGELRDLETVSIALETAETGHLVFGTLHTVTAAAAVDRMVDQFPADRQNQVRTVLADVLRGAVAQTLLRRKGGGRIAALEILVSSPAVANLIREGKTFQIPSLMQTGRNLGMQTLVDAATALVKSGVVDPEEAYGKVPDRTALLAAFQRQGVAWTPA
ncbi:MAG TPA: type IV pilus twitching motility protein PilT [Gemmatimonadota bacterium]|jgi:twitching motility protein PilT